MNDNPDYGYFALPCKSVDEIPKSCWTCVKHICVISGMTTCFLIDRPSHTKMGVEPCPEYEPNIIWLEVG